jgi:lactate permease
VRTSFGWQTAAEAGRSISLFGHAGALLLYTSILIFSWYKWRGVLPTAPAAAYDGRQIIQKTVRGSVKPTIGVYTLIALALTMQHAGMTQVLALMLSANTGLLFPFLSPLIGALGSFMTGSNTNSNVVFGQLQQQTALALGRSVPLILAAQTAGAAIGSSFAPAKVIVGSSTVPGAREGDVLRYAFLSGLAILVILGIIALVIS